MGRALDTDSKCSKKHSAFQLFQTIMPITTSFDSAVETESHCSYSRSPTKLTQHPKQFVQIGNTRHYPNEDIVIGLEGQHPVNVSDLLRSSRRIANKTSFEVPSILGNPIHNTFGFAPADPQCFTSPVQRPPKDSFHASVQRMEDSVHGSETPLDIETSHGRSIESPLQSSQKLVKPKVGMIQKTIKLDDEPAIDNFLSSSFSSAPQNVLKPILKALIKSIEPDKQKKWPYVLSSDRVKPGRATKHRRQIGEGGLKQPPWWPKDVRHREPDHLYKHECIALGVGLMWYIIEDKDFHKKYREGAVRKFRREEVDRLLPSWMDNCINSSSKEMSEEQRRKFNAKKPDREKKAEIWRHSIKQLFQVAQYVSDVKFDIADADQVNVEFYLQPDDGPKRKKAAKKRKANSEFNMGSATEQRSSDSPKSNTSFILDEGSDQERGEEISKHSLKISTVGVKRKASDSNESDGQQLQRKITRHERNLMNYPPDSPYLSRGSSMEPELQSSMTSSSSVHAHRSPVSGSDMAMIPQESTLAANHSLAMTPTHPVSNFHSRQALTFVHPVAMMAHIPPTSPYLNQGDGMQIYTPQADTMHMSFSSDTSSPSFGGSPHDAPMSLIGHPSIPLLEQYLPEINDLSFISTPYSTPFTAPSHTCPPQVRSFPTPHLSATIPQDMKYSPQTWVNLHGGPVPFQ